LINFALNPALNSYVSMNMQVQAKAQVPAEAQIQAKAKAKAKAQQQAQEQTAKRASRRLYLPTILIACLAAWLSWRGWTALEQGTELAGSMNASRYQLAGPVVLGFLAVVCTLEQIFPAQRRPLFARGHRLDFCYAVFYPVQAQESHPARTQPADVDPLPR
jgi:hypothetical protein